MGKADERESMAPSLLVAMPQLLDPNFARTVILLTSHSEEGGMGFVVNRPLRASVADVLEGLDIEWMGNPDATAWGGGPVQPQSGGVLFAPEGKELPDESTEIVPGMFLSASLDALRSLARRPPKRFRLVLGYAGWGSGQLEDEILEGAWLMGLAERGLVFDVPHEEAWLESFRSQGLDPFSIVPGHGVQ